MNISPNWSAFSSPSQEVMVEKPQTQEQVQTQDVVQEQIQSQAPPTNQQEQKEVKPDVQAVDNPATESPENKPENKPDVQTQEQATSTEAEIQLKLEDIKDAPVVFPKDSLRSLAQEVGINIENESREDLIKSIKENFVPKTEYEKLNLETEEKAYSRLKPEVATMLKWRQLLPQDIPDHVIFNPTGKTDWMLQLSDEQLVRQAMMEAADEQGNPLYDEETVNTEMELLAEKGGIISHKAKVLRGELTNEKQKILTARSNIFNHYEQQHQQAQIALKEEKAAHFKKALDNVSTFLGVPVPKGASELIYAKYQKGAYDSILNDPTSMVSAVLQLEYGDSISKHLISKTKAETKKEIVEKMSDVPSKQQQAGSRVNVVAEDGHDNWAALKKS